MANSKGEKIRLSDDLNFKRLNRLAIGGDNEAFGELISLAFPHLLRFFISKGRNPQTSEDLAQETITRALSSRERFNHGSFASWIYTIAGNLNIDFYRVKINREETPGDPVIDLYSRESDGDYEAILNELEKSQQRRLVLSAAEGLSPLQREVVKLQLEDRSDDEIARILRSNQESIRVLKGRAKKSVKEKLNGEKM